MAEVSFPKSVNDYDCRNEPSNYTMEIRHMMHGFGDCSEPLIESAKIIEDVVLRQMRIIVNRACEIADKRGSNVVNAEDFLFLLRKDKVKLQRLLKYLRLKEFKSSVSKLMPSESSDDIPDFDRVDSQLHKRPYDGFLNLIDTTGELLENSSVIDHVKHNRHLRAEMMSRKMDEARYIEFSKARSISFANKNRHKFSDWICPDGDIVISKQGLRLSFFNPYTYKPYQHSKGNVTKPITPSELNEALRRYWSPQLDMAAPFHRWSMRNQHIKLFSC
ncbi:transcription initiation protein SPT3 homolog isoform X2 [Orussus abietinus]|uniref:transcription initiation protein SPT3 homolog isoform X2 n=1 Tax=Orussus abietinus TaxID=222816 RepID=UPI000625FA24|nr:transcription initiation protein SPT3 homolog isoform X2 [Orussus abietinus]